MQRRTHQPAHAYTIIEVLAVITVAGLLAGTVVPAVARITEGRALAGVYETSRMIGYARATGAASGLPAGIRFDTDTDTLTLVTYDGTGIIEADAMRSMPDPVPLAALYGTDITALRFSAAAGLSAVPDTETIWFDHRGTPHLRAAANDAWIDIAATPTVQFASGASITINNISGLIEVNP